jgi:type III pantothenate kinase
MHESFSQHPPQLFNRDHGGAIIVAVDVGNSQIKLGRFQQLSLADGRALPEPTATLDLEISHATGLFNADLLRAWCETYLSASTCWLIGSVHQGASDLFANTIANWSRDLEVRWPVRKLNFDDVPIEIRVSEPARVGIDRLLAAFAANRLRKPDRAAIVVDLGTAITVDLVEADGAFAGGAILPGIGMAGRALANQTDALPHVVLDHAKSPPVALGKSTTAAIESGLYWGAVGAVNEIASRLAFKLTSPPDFFITGGAAPMIASSIAMSARAQHVPHLVLAGIVLLIQTNDESAG